MRNVMRVMGKHLLHKLAMSSAGDYAGAIGALYAELEAARWDEPSAALADYPCARLEGHRLKIPIANGVFIQLAINSVAGVVLVEFAG